MSSSKLSLWRGAKLALALLTVTFSISGPARGQAVYGSIVGEVTDQSGAVVPGAAVNVVSVETGQQFNEAADGSGRYNVVNLLPGHYNVRVTSKGFRTVEETGLNITPNTVARVDVHLEIGQTSEQVTVAADALHLQTENADTHTELTSKQVENIPLGGYRNYQTLINLVPGATPASTQNSIIDTPGRALRTNINGGNAQTNITRVDGAESINVWLPHHVGYVAPAETVDVVNVTTSAADADQGLAGASSITVVTKSGSNELHGSGFEFHNDQHLNARNFFLQGTKPLSIYNNYGGTIGGPILKNKLFYFFSFDGTNQKTAGNGLYTLPTADQRAGNFSAYLPTTVIYDPATGQRDQYGNLNGVGRTPFPNNTIPTDRISTIAQKIQSYYPAPNLGGTGNNYSATGGPILNRYNYDTKINWARNDKHTIWGKYGRMNAGTSGIGILGIAGGDAPGQDASPGTGDTVVQVATIGHTYTFSPNVVLDGNFGFNRMDQTVTGHDYGQNFGTILGITGLNGPDIKQSGFPNLTIGGYESFGSPSWMPAFRHDETFTQSDNLTITKGAHEFRLGFDLVRHHLNHYQPELSSGGARGAFDFNGNLTSINNGAYSPTQYNAYADFLLGASDNIQKGLQYILMTGREWQFGWYGQDRWQVSKNLTVNLGLRYEFYPLMTRCCGKGIERYDPATNLVYLGGRGGVPKDVGFTVSHKLFSPRAGIAYRLGDNTVIRTGYGLNFDPIPFSRPLRGFYPLTINSNFKQPNSYAPAGTLATGIPPVVGPDLSTGIVPLPGDASERSPWGGLIHRGYVQSWNFTIERKLLLNLVTSIAYVGQHSVHLLADRDINTGFPGSGTTLLPYNIAYGRTTPTNMWDGYLSSSYNSLQASINRSFSQGLMLKGAYTYSHAIDYTDDDGWAGVDWNYAPMFQRNRATAGFDRTHVFQLGWIYELPVGKGKQFLSSGLVSKVVGGWQFSGIEASYTGNPFYVYAPNTSVNDGGTNTQTANQIMATVPFLGGVGPGKTWYDPAAFGPVTNVAYGNSGRNKLRGPGTWNTDMSIQRMFPIKERVQLQFRTEFYNLPNTSHFNGPSDTTVRDQSFMVINSSYGERTIRFGFRLQF